MRAHCVVRAARGHGAQLGRLAAGAAGAGRGAAPARRRQLHGDAAGVHCRLPERHLLQQRPALPKGV